MDRGRGSEDEDLGIGPDIADHVQLLFQRSGSNPVEYLLVESCSLAVGLGDHRSEHKDQIQLIVCSQDEVGVGARGDSSVGVETSVYLVRAEDKRDRRRGCNCLRDSDLRSAVGSKRRSPASFDVMCDDGSGSLGPGDSSLWPYVGGHPFGNSNCVIGGGRAQEHCQAGSPDSGNKAMSDPLGHR